MSRTSDLGNGQSADPDDRDLPADAKDYDKHGLLKIYITPRHIGGREGGVQRVVEAQRRHLPTLGFDVTDDPRQADIVAAHAGAWTPAAQRKPGSVTVAHCHGLYWNDEQYQWPSAAYERNQAIIDTFRKADGVVVPCEWVADILRKDMWLDPEVVYNGVDLPNPRHLADRTPGGSILWNKARVDEVCEVDSLGQLVRELPDASFVSTFAPKGAKLPNLTVTGVIPHDDMLQLLMDTGVYLATTREVFSISVVEAMAYGVPVVGYDFGGQREIVRHRENGWLAPPGDVAGLAAGIEYVYAHWEEMSQAAQATAQGFSWKAQMSKLAEYYVRLLRESQHAVKVSVVMPSHNLGAYLPEALSSAINQEVPGGHEVIVVDDASTDDSPEILRQIWREHDDSKSPVALQVVFEDTNRYLAEALNRGIALARGKYIVNLDPDNLLPPKALARMAAALDDSEAADVVYGPVKFVKDDLTPGYGVDAKGLANPPWPPEKFDYTAQMSHRNQVQSSAMFRRKVWERAKGYRQHVAQKVDRKGQPAVGEGLVRLNSDAEFWCRAATLGFKFANIGGAPTLVYRQRPGESMSSTVQDFDWTAWCPKVRVPCGVSGKIYTMEPVIVSVVVRVPDDDEAARVAWKSIESLWTQSFANWECLVVSAYGHEAPPYARYVGSITEAFSAARGAYILPLDAGDFLHPEAITRLLGAVQWSEQTHVGDGRARFAYSNWGTLLGSGSHPASDSRVGAVLFPKWVLPNIEVGWDNWVGRLTDAHLCGQWVDDMLLKTESADHVDGRDTILAGCGCGGGRRRAGTPRGGCSGPGCGASASARRVGAPPVTFGASTQVGGGPQAVQLEYVGKNPTRTFRTRNKTYNVSVDGNQKYVEAHTEDVPTLMATGVFRRVGDAALATA